MTSIRDKVRKQLETASTKETAAVTVVITPPNKSERGYHIDLSDVKNEGQRTKIAHAVAAADSYSDEDDEYLDIVEQAVKDKMVYASKKTLAEIKAAIKTHVPGVVFKDSKESASIETAKKHKSTAKMVSKISAIIQSMGMSEGQWDSISKQVFKKAFGGKREKANVEKTSGPKNTNEFCNTLGHDLERLNTKVKTMAKNPRKTDAMFVADELEGMADFARSGIAVFK